MRLSVFIGPLSLGSPSRSNLVRLEGGKQVTPICIRVILSTEDIVTTIFGRSCLLAGRSRARSLQLVSVSLRNEKRFEVHVVPFEFGLQFFDAAEHLNFWIFEVVGEITQAFQINERICCFFPQ